MIMNAGTSTNWKIHKPYKVTSNNYVVNKTKTRTGTVSAIPLIVFEMVTNPFTSIGPFGASGWLPTSSQSAYKRTLSRNTPKCSLCQLRSNT